MSDKKPTKVSEMPYRIKFHLKGEEKNVRFGGLEQYSDRAKEEWANGKIVINDALTGQWYTVALKDIEYEAQPYTWHKDEKNDYDKYMDAQYEAHKVKSDKAGEGVKLHKMFSVGVADGYAHYVITKVNKKSVKIEWRAFGADDYVDATLGYGGSFPMHCVERHVGWADTKKKIFAKAG